MNNRESKTPVKKNLEEIVQRAKKGISQKNKEYLLTELEDLAKSIEDWKAENSGGLPHKKAS